MLYHEITLRHRICFKDLAQIRQLIASSGYFSGEETELAEEVARDGLSGGPESGYSFVFADIPDSGGSRVAGYACYGHIPCTGGSFDLYWLAVQDVCRGQGIGRKLMNAVEKSVVSAQGRKLFVETSSRSQYASTRGFYAACGFREEARLLDYYLKGEDMVVFSKVFSRTVLPAENY